MTTDGIRPASFDMAKAHAMQPDWTTSTGTRTSTSLIR